MAAAQIRGLDGKGPAPLPLWRPEESGIWAVGPGAARGRSLAGAEAAVPALQLGGRAHTAVGDGHLGMGSPP